MLSLPRCFATSKKRVPDAARDADPELGDLIDEAMQRGAGAADFGGNKPRSAATNAKDDDGSSKTMRRARGGSRSFSEDADNENTGESEPSESAGDEIDVDALDESPDEAAQRKRKEKRKETRKEKKRREKREGKSDSEIARAEIESQTRIEQTETEAETEADREAQTQTQEKRPNQQPQLRGRGTHTREKENRERERE